MLFPLIAFLICSYSLASFAKRHQKSFVLFAIAGLFSSLACYVSFVAIADALLSLFGVFIPYVSTLAGIVATASFTYLLMLSLENKWSTKKTKNDILDDHLT